MSEDFPFSGTLRGQYAFQREIGRGGMATVYLAHDRRHDRPVAVKVLRPELSASVAADRFRREITIAARLSHPLIVPLFDSGEVERRLFYVMPFVDGKSLADLLRVEGRLTLGRARAIVEDIAEALQYAHRQGIVHRDIKPANILLAGNHAVVADFGVARALEIAALEGLTTTGIAIGTPAYMSPEQAAGDPTLDARSDIYSLGCVLYEMLAGQTPFADVTPRELIGSHIARQAPSLAEHRDDLPPQVTSAVQRALAKAPEERPASCAEFVASLRTPAPAALGPIVPQKSDMPTRRARLWVGLATIISGALIGLMVMTGEPEGFARPESVVVLAYKTSGSDSVEEALAIELAHGVTRELNQWDAVRAVPPVALSGPRFDLGMRPGATDLIQDGLALARAVRVQALVALTVSIRNDTAAVEANVFSASSGASVGRPVQSRRPLDSIDEIISGIAGPLLGLGETGRKLPALRRMSTAPAALLAAERADEELRKGRLEEAEAYYRRAIDIDSTFASALHGLAQSLYWQTATNNRRLRDRAPEISRLSTSAVRHAVGLPTQDSLHIWAFHAFQRGDFPTSRGLYNRALVQDSVDVAAWLGLGIVEYRDPWLVTKPGGAAEPRSDLNLAIRAFAEAVRLQPTFDLGYGHLFDIHRRIARTMRTGACPGFFVPPEQPIPAWEPGEVDSQASFCPVIVDSIVWLRRAVFDTLDQVAPEAGAARRYRGSLRSLRRWVDYAADEIRPRRALLAALLDRTSQIGAIPPESTLALADEAHTIMTEILALTRDTLAEDHLTLGGILLARGQLDHALSETSRGIREMQSQGKVPPSFAANVLLASGNPVRASEVLAVPRARRFVMDDATGSLVSYAGGESVVERTRILGVAQLGEARPQRELDSLVRVWAPARFAPSERRALFRDAILRAGFGMVGESSWLTAWEDEARSDHPLFQNLFSGDSTPGALEAAIQASSQLRGSPLSPSVGAFLAGMIGLGRGNARLALVQFTRIDSLAFHVDTYDIGWGLRPAAMFRRAQALEMLGERGPALTAYRDFIASWADGDTLVQPAVETARERVSALTAGRQ